MKTLLTLFSLSILLIAPNAHSSQNADLEQVKIFVNSVGNNIIDIAKENISEEEKIKRIIGEVDKSIDSAWISRFVLGINYRRASDDQKQRFQELYRSFMINTYGPKFKNYDGRKFAVTKVTKQKSYFLAKAEFLPRKSNVPILVDFRVKERGGKLVILDFITEGISLIETQRSEFNSAINSKGMEKFLEMLAQKVEKLKRPK